MQRVNRHNVDVLGQILFKGVLLRRLDRGLASNSCANLGGGAVLGDNRVNVGGLNRVDDEIGYSRNGVAVLEHDNARTLEVSRELVVVLRAVTDDHFVASGH